MAHSEGLLHGRQNSVDARHHPREPTGGKRGGWVVQSQWQARGWQGGHDQSGDVVRCKYLSSPPWSTGWLYRRLHNGRLTFLSAQMTNLPSNTSQRMLKCCKSYWDAVHFYSTERYMKYLPDNLFVCFKRFSCIRVTQTNENDCVVYCQ